MESHRQNPSLQGRLSQNPDVSPETIQKLKQDALRYIQSINLLNQLALIVYPYTNQPLLKSPLLDIQLTDYCQILSENFNFDLPLTVLQQGFIEAQFDQALILKVKAMFHSTRNDFLEISHSRTSVIRENITRRLMTANRVFREFYDEINIHCNVLKTKFLGIHLLLPKIDIAEFVQNRRELVVDFNFAEDDSKPSNPEGRNILAQLGALNQLRFFLSALISNYFQDSSYNPLFENYTSIYSIILGKEFNYKETINGLQQSFNQAGINQDGILLMTVCACNALSEKFQPHRRKMSPSKISDITQSLERYKKNFTALLEKVTGLYNSLEGEFLLTFQAIVPTRYPGLQQHHLHANNSKSDGPAQERMALDLPPSKNIC